MEVSVVPLDTLETGVSTLSGNSVETYFRKRLLRYMEIFINVPNPTNGGTPAAASSSPGTLSDKLLDVKPEPSTLAAIIFRVPATSTEN